MTAAHEPRRAPGVHLSAEELSEVAEGRQEGAQGGVGPAPVVAEHLRDCAQCREEADAMADLLAALADLELPTIPQDVALRIDAALAQAASVDPPLAHVSAEDGAPRGAAEGSSAPAPASTLSGAGPGTPSGHPHGSRRPPSALPETRRPASRGASSRRSLHRVAGWTLGSLALAGGLAGLATVIGSQSGTSTSSSRGSAASGRVPGNPSVQNAVPDAGSAAQSMLVSWTKLVLTGATPSTAGSGMHANSLGSIPSSSVAAASVSQCEANPAFAGRHLLGATSGLYGTTPTVLVVYANGDGSRSVYAVAYVAPCAPSDYRVLTQGTVSE